MKKLHYLVIIISTVFFLNIIAQEKSQESETIPAGSEEIKDDTVRAHIPKKSRVKIFIRSANKRINREQVVKKIVLFDSNRDFGTNELTTIVYPGTKIIWTRDRKSGIKSITGIIPKEKKGPVFTGEIKKRFLLKGYKYFVENNAKTGVTEAYSIEYLDINNKKRYLDPEIRIDPPK